MDRFDGMTSITETAINTVVQFNEGRLNFSRRIRASDGQVRVKFNFHYRVGNAEEAAAKMAGSIVRNKERAIRALESYR